VLAETETKPEEEPGSDDGSALDLDEIMADMADPINLVSAQDNKMNSEYFKLQL